MSKDYFHRVKEIAQKISKDLVDFEIEREITRTPTQVSSNFITNREQGDWAENLIMNAINNTSKNYIAVKYGKSDEIHAGEEGFDSFYQEFQNELNTIGKRPDLLLFNKNDFDKSLGLDISHHPHTQITNYVKKAIAGIEIRSSAFLMNKYDEAMLNRHTKYTIIALEIKNKILKEYINELSHPARESYIELLQNISENTLSITDFKVPGWRSTTRLSELNGLFKELKIALKEIHKRDFLSITPKVEDLALVYQWIKIHNVPHFYFQVFFDKVYGISFEHILQIISNSDNEGTFFHIESDVKNQNKTTIKVNSKAGVEIAQKIDEPTHNSVRKELSRGRLLFYVTFRGGKAYLDINNLTKVLEIREDDF